MIFFSQNGQDKFIVDLFKEKREGIFMDIGSYDGVNFSNTFYLEKELGWSGICVEPNPIVYKQLISNRTCVCINACISDTAGSQEFIAVTGYGSMLSGIRAFIDEQHMITIDKGISTFGGSKTIINVDSLSIKTILDTHFLPIIDYCNIDVEGAEMAVLKSIDFSKVTIKVFTIENRDDKKDIINFLKPLGYKLINRLGADEIFELNSKRYGAILNFTFRKLKHKISFYKKLLINKLQKNAVSILF